MRSQALKDKHRYSLPDAIHATVANYLYQTFNDDDQRIANLDRWTHQRIGDENLAKVMLVLESPDPAESCYRDLAREIELEAASGIFLVNDSARDEHLQHVLGEPGVSGQLQHHMQAIAPQLLPGETGFSIDEQYRIWAELEARHDRAHLDASVSEIIMSFMMDDARVVRDMTNVMRALSYTWHEDRVRRESDLPRLLDEMAVRDLRTMMTELKERCGNYDARASEIRREADARSRIPLS